MSNAKTSYGEKVIDLRDLAEEAVELLRRMDNRTFAKFARLCVQDNLSSRLSLSLMAEEQELQPSHPSER